MPRFSASTIASISGSHVLAFSCSESAPVSRFGIGARGVPSGCCRRSCANSTTSSSSIGSCHRRPWSVKSSFSFSPTGKLSSERSGCSTMSTSSITHAPSRKSSIASAHTRTESRSPVSRYSLLLRSLSVQSTSTKLSMSDLIACGVVMTTAAFSLADSSLADSDGFPGVERSHANV